MNLKWNNSNLIVARRSVASLYSIGRKFQTIVLNPKTSKNVESPIGSKAQAVAFAESFYSSSAK